MDVGAAITKMQQAGFTIAVNNGCLTVEPDARLNDHQRDWLKAHRPVLLRFLQATIDQNVILLVQMFDATVMAVE